MTNTNTKVYSLDFLNKLSNKDQCFIDEMVSSLIKSSINYLEKSHNLLVKEDYDELFKETHKFIPGTSFLEAKPLENKLMVLEDVLKKKDNLTKVPFLLDNVKKEINILLKQLKYDFKHLKYA